MCYRIFIKRYYSKRRKKRRKIKILYYFTIKSNKMSSNYIINSPLVLKSTLTTSQPIVSNNITSTNATTTNLSTSYINFTGANPTTTDVNNKITSLIVSGTNSAGSFSFDVDTSGGGKMFTIVFNKTYSSPPYIVITPTSGPASNVNYSFEAYVQSSTTGFSFWFNKATTPVNGISYNYICIGTL
jgi:hypothetical protein